MTATTDNKARKGDLVLVERVSRNCYSVAAYAEAKAAGRTLPETETSYTFGMVASATREGLAKTWHSLAYGSALIGTYGEDLHSRLVNRYWTMPAKTIDVEAVLRAAKAHHWPDHPDHPRAFDTFAEAKACAKPYVREGATR